LVAALIACIMMMILVLMVLALLYTMRITELERENKELRRELESLRKSAPPRAAP
jgi:hypothetical protein